MKGIDHSKDAVTGRFEYVPGKNGATVNGHGSPHLDIKASYLVGCDGANSAVRNLMDITCTDLGFENDWLVLDLVSSNKSKQAEPILSTNGLQLLKDDYIPAALQKLGNAQICDPARPTTVVFGGRGRRRFEFMRMPGEDREALLSDDMMWELLLKWGYNRVRLSINWL